MYSIVLFIVETSLSGLRGSGHRPTSAVRSTTRTVSSGTRPVSSTWSCRPSRSRSATSSSKQSPEPISVKPMSVRPIWCTHDVGGGDDHVDAVLGSHHPEVRREVGVPAPARGVRRPGAQEVRVGPVRTTVTSSGPLPPRRRAISA